MNYRDLLVQAKAGNPQSVSALLELYKPLLIKESIVNGIYDEDLYQELCLTLLHCIGKFKA